MLLRVVVFDYFEIMLFCFCGCSSADKKTKRLTPGELKRLSIAEEIVHGPSLIYLDEPITGIEDPNDVSVLMNVMREMVNQERTVVATVHQVYPLKIESNRPLY